MLEEEEEQVEEQEEEQEEEEEEEEAEEAAASGCLVFCQRFNNMHCFMFLYCFLLCCHGFIYGLAKLNIFYFMKEHHLILAEKFILLFGYEIAFCLGVLLISYYGGRGHRPKWLAFSSLLVGVGSLFFSFPYINARRYKFNIKFEDICHPVKIFESCPDTSLPFYTNYVYFFIIGLSLMGIAVVPLYILGKTFIDDNCEAYSSGTLIGIAETTTVTGFYIGTALGGLQVRISLESVVDKTMRSTQWLKSWRNHFITGAFISWLPFVPLFCFPRSLPVTKTDEKNQQHSSDVELKVKLQESKSSIKDLFASLWLLMKNAVFLCLALARAAEYSLFGAITLFLPTYITNQYDLSADVATMISGFVLLPGGGIGQLMGGVIISKLKMTCKDMMKFVMATSAITVLLILPISLIKCENVKFAGVTENYEGTGQLGNLTAPCNSHCSCSASFYSPVCGRDNIEYFSPCFAGCLESKSTSSRKLYYNCSCITKGFLKEDIQGYFNDAELMKCDIKCYKLPLVISFILSSSLFCSLANVPLIVSMLRVVSQNHHSLALAVAYLILRILGIISGQALIKRIIRDSCILHDLGICGFPGICRMYSKTRMVFLLIGIVFFYKALSIFFTSVAFCLYSRPTLKHHDVVPPPGEEIIHFHNGKN